MKTPTLKEIEQASHEQLCRWWRFLPIGSYPEGKAGDRLKERLFKEYGGFTPEISKSLGWR